MPGLLFQPIKIIYMTMRYLEQYQERCLRRDVHRGQDIKEHLNLKTNINTYLNIIKQLLDKSCHKNITKTCGVSQCSSSYQQMLRET